MKKNTRIKQIDVREKHKRYCEKKNDEECDKENKWREITLKDKRGKRKGRVKML